MKVFINVLVSADILSTEFESFEELLKKHLNKDNPYKFNVENLGNKGRRNYRRAYEVLMDYIDYDNMGDDERDNYDRRLRACEL